MNIGDRVKIVDGSWAIVVGPNGYFHELVGLQKRTYKILLIQEGLPSCDMWNDIDYKNNVLLQDVNTDRQVYSRTEFLAPASLTGTYDRVTSHQVSVEIMEDFGLDNARQCNELAALLRLPPGVARDRILVCFYLRVLQ